MSSTMLDTLQYIISLNSHTHKTKRGRYYLHLTDAEIKVKLLIKSRAGL